MFSVFLALQAVEQTFEVPVIWDVVTLMWRHYNACFWVSPLHGDLPGVDEIQETNAHILTRAFIFSDRRQKEWIVPSHSTCKSAVDGRGLTPSNRTRVASLDAAGSSITRETRAPMRRGSMGSPLDLEVGPVYPSLAG